MKDADIVQKVQGYLDGRIELHDLEAWVFDREPPEQSQAWKHLVGVFSEASHAHWQEKDIREELAAVLRAFGHALSER